MLCSVSNLASRVGLSAQIGLVVAVLGLASLTPPVRGEILLIPLTARSAQHVAALALGHDARLLARGPFAGSLVVHGERARLATAMLRAAILPVAAASFGCGDPADISLDG